MGTIETQTFVTGYSIMEKIQMIGFFTQEVILSSIFISSAMSILRTSLRPSTQRVMRQLIAINIVIIIMDLILLGLECASLYIIQISIKGVIYSIKLKLEFAILGKLVTFVENSSAENERRTTWSLGFITTNRSIREDGKEVAVEETVDLSKVNFEAVVHAELHQRRQESAGQMEIGIARFEHTEGSRTLASIGLRSGSMSGPIRREGE